MFFKWVTKHVLENVLVVVLDFFGTMKTQIKCWCFSFLVSKPAAAFGVVSLFVPEVGIAAAYLSSNPALSSKQILQMPQLFLTYLEWPIAGLATNSNFYSGFFLYKIIDLPGGQINEPS